jgi:hypothetical protein
MAIYFFNAITVTDTASIACFLVSTLILKPFLIKLAATAPPWFPVPPVTNIVFIVIILIEI